MTEHSIHQLTLDRPAKYQIKVPGKLDPKWFEFAQKMTIAYGTDQDDRLVSILTGFFDQSALQGFLRHLYALGVPLLSVLYLGGEFYKETGK